MFCGDVAPAGNGPAGGVANQACGVGGAYVGSAIGAISTVIGPSIVGSAVLAPVTVSAGPVQY